MKTERIRWLAALLAAAMLTGCGAKPAQETQPETKPAVTEETMPETTVATEPKDPILNMMDQMSIEDRVGQIFLVRCPEEGAAEAAAQYGFGGYILFGRDFEQETPDSVRQTIAAYQSAVGIPMLIAVDEEGGTVKRVSAFPAFRQKPFASPRDYFSAGGMEAVLTAEREKAELLQGLGINVNMAPVCDITTNAKSFMYPRSLGQSPEITGEFAAAAVECMGQNQVGGVLKHFPGYGNNVDTHNGIAVDSRPLEQLEGADLVPFRMSIESGCGAILMSHNIVLALDDSLPASLSPAVHRYLRGMGFDGVIITDELSMGAVAQVYGPEEAAVLAVEAGNDLLCLTEYAVQYPAVLQAVLDGRISMETLDSAVYRVLKWKQQIGLI